jgi:hypothetical protein
MGQVILHDDGVNDDLVESSAMIQHVQASKLFTALTDALSAFKNSENY